MLMACHQLEAEPELDSQMESELHRILKKRKASSDNYISGGSLVTLTWSSMLDDIFLCKSGGKTIYSLDKCSGFWVTRERCDAIFGMLFNTQMAL